MHLSKYEGGLKYSHPNHKGHHLSYFIASNNMMQTLHIGFGELMYVRAAKAIRGCR